MLQRRGGLLHRHGPAGGLRHQYEPARDSDFRQRYRRLVCGTGARRNLSGVRRGPRLAERRARFLVKVQGGYQIAKAVRDLCVFARHDLTRDPPFSRLDLVSCRNVLIYMGPVLQKRVLETLHYALNPGGYLYLGKSESLGENSSLFSLEDRKNKIYSRKPGAGRPQLRPRPGNSRRQARPK